MWIKVIILLVLKGLSLSWKHTNTTMAAAERIGPGSALLRHSLCLLPVFSSLARRIFRPGSL